MTLESKQVLVETLDGLLLQDVVNAIPPIQHPHLHLRLFFSLWFRALWDLLLLLCLLFLLFDLIGYDGQLSLKLGRRGVSASKIVEGLPGAPKGTDKTMLQVRAHPGETLLQLEMKPLPPFVMWDQNRLQVQLWYYHGLNPVCHWVQRMVNIEESFARGQLVRLFNLFQSSHCQEHSDWRTQGEEIHWLKVQRVVDH